MRRWFWKMGWMLLVVGRALLAQGWFHPDLTYAVINPPPIIPATYPWLVLIQNQSGYNDLLLCSSLAGSVTALDTDPSYTKAYVGYVGGRIIYTRAYRGVAFSKSVDLMSVKLNGTGAVLLASSFTTTPHMSSAWDNPDVSVPKSKVVLDPTYGRVVYELDLPDGTHDIQSINPDGTSPIALCNSTRDERLKGCIDGRVIYELQWSATDIDLYSVVSNGLSRFALSASGENETFFNQFGSKVYFLRGTGGNNAMWSVNPDGTSMVNLGPGFSNSPLDLDVRFDGKVVMPERITTGLDLYVENADGSGRMPLVYGVGDAGCSPRFIGDRVVYVTGRDASRRPTALSSVRADGSGGRVSLVTGTNVLTWSPVNGGTQLLVQSDDGKQSTLYVMNPDGTGLTYLSHTGGDDTFLGESQGRAVYSHSIYRGEQADIYSNLWSGRDWEVLAPSTFPESLGALLDGIAYYTMDLGSYTMLRRVRVDHTENTYLCSLGGKVAVVDAFN
jgi:hypothetical protein